MTDNLDFITVGEVLEHLADRRTIRAYRRDEKPGRRLIRLILNVAASAPYVSHDNEPPWRFVAMDDPALISAIARAVDPEDSGEPDHLGPDDPNFNPRTYFKNAPHVVVMLSKLPDRDQAPEEMRDSIAYDMTVSYGAALGALMSAAHLAGFATGWVGSFTASQARRVDAVERLLGVKAPWRVHSIIPIGYAAEKGETRELSYEEMVEFL